MRTAVLSALFFVLVVQSSAQEKLNIDRSRACTWDRDTITDDLYGFEPDDQAKKFVANIMKFAGLPQNFTIKAANVDNAAAVMQDNRRLILYSQQFVQKAMTASGTPWAAVSVMAHEIGHHLSGHTLLNGETTRLDQELQADQFSGHVLQRMGATMEQAKVAVESLTNVKGDPLHPPKTARVAAVTNGWVAAKEQAAKRATTSPAESAVATDDARLKALEEQLKEQKAALEREERERAAAERRRREEAEEAERLREEREERERERQEREERRRRREEEEASMGRYCCDVYGNRYCPLVRKLPMGSTCYCTGLYGYGLVCN